jgi:hypothetical protein
MQGPEQHGSDIAAGHYRELAEARRAVSAGSA